MEVTADLPWSQHKGMDSWMGVPVPHLHKGTWKTPGDVEVVVYTVYVISPKKINKKEHTKQNQCATGDECHPAWEAKPLDPMTPLHLRQKKLRRKVTEYQSNELSTQRQGRECHEAVFHIALARSAFTPFMLSRSCLHHQRKKLQQFAVRV